MKNKRPINLSVSQILDANKSSPIAMASILHRVSGLLLFVLIPVILYLLQNSLASKESFDAVLDSGFLRFVAWVFVAGIGYHFVMGLKHLLADLGMNEELESGRRAAWISIVIAVIVVVASFVWVML